MTGYHQLKNYAEVDVGRGVVMAADADEDAIFLEIFNYQAEIHYDCGSCLCQRGLTGPYKILGHVMQGSWTDDG